MSNLFAYGTLLCADIIQAILGYMPRNEAGLLKGYCRRKVRNQSYPGIFPDPAGKVPGTIYYSLSESDGQKLDQFEGSLYIPTPVEIDLANGTKCNAVTYVVKAEFLGELEKKEWALDEFIRDHKKHFLQTFEGFSEKQ